ncbi:hypothetical protein MSS93_14375 [Deinococcus radiodurans]|nr:hypothetical protein MSS93_14375 [Deinococcus radiodurans]
MPAAPPLAPDDLSPAAALPEVSIAGTLPQIARLPHALGLTLAVLLLGLATSLAGPFMSLFAVQQVGMTPLQLGLFLTFNALSAVLVSTRLGRWADRRSDRKPLVLLTLAAGVLAYLALSGVRSVYGVMATGVLLLAVSSAAFPQVFAFARSGFAQAPGDLPEKAVTVLRAVFSFAWVVGPGWAPPCWAAGRSAGCFCSRRSATRSPGCPCCLFARPRQPPHSRTARPRRSPRNSALRPRRRWAGWWRRLPSTAWRCTWEWSCFRCS